MNDAGSISCRLGVAGSLCGRDTFLLVYTINGQRDGAERISGVL